MRISDWSSDVCSSDLLRPLRESLSASLRRPASNRLLPLPEFPAAAAAEHAGTKQAHRKPDDERDPQRLPAEREQVDGFRIVGRGAGRHRERRGEGKYLRAAGERKRDVWGKRV